MWCVGMVDRQVFSNLPRLKLTLARAGHVPAGHVMLLFCGPLISHLPALTAGVTSAVSWWMVIYAVNTGGWAAPFS